MLLQGSKDSNPVESSQVRSLNSSFSQHLDSSAEKLITQSNSGLSSSEPFNTWVPCPHPQPHRPCPTSHQHWLLKGSNVELPALHSVSLSTVVWHLFTSDLGLGVAGERDLVLLGSRLCVGYKVLVPFWRSATGYYFWDLGFCICHRGSWGNWTPLLQIWLILTGPRGGHDRVS